MSELNKFQQWAIKRKPIKETAKQESEPEKVTTPKDELREAWEDWKYECKPILTVMNIFGWFIIITCLTAALLIITGYMGNV